VTGVAPGGYLRKEKGPGWHPAATKNLNYENLPVSEVIKE
jgi:hypothetical protein